jgi:cellulose synthase/poly-beta-1,6-N-acetylglucosamine synthase-like glycosyltransferase
VALAAQRGPAFEVVVVDDGSHDAAAVASAVAGAPHAWLVRADGRGPAAARNRGAAVAHAPRVCFTDDDCRPGADWLAVLEARLREGTSVVAGPTRVGDGDSSIVTAAQTVTNHLVESSLDARHGTVTFAPTSNLACEVAVLRALPFDEDFPLAAGEDREWCRRVAAHGAAIAYDERAVVEHLPELSLTGFWRQQARYGRGAYQVHRGRPAGERLQPASFYRSLMRKGFSQGARVGSLVVLAQIATATGIARGYVSARASGR